MPSLFTPQFQKEKGEIVIRQPKEKDPTLSWFVLFKIFFFYWSWFVLCIIALVMMKLFETEIVKENDCWWLLNNFSSRNWNPPGQNYLKINCYYLLVTKLLIRNSKKLFVFILECLWLNSINKFQIKIHSPY